MKDQRGKRENRDAPEGKEERKRVVTLADKGAKQKKGQCCGSNIVTADENQRDNGNKHDHAGKFPAEDRNQTGQKKEKHSKREAAEETADFSNHHDRKGFLSDSI